jgi:prepilin-type N-terminal cleavage/methylation domain-containing protein/prepilin-type processing-associated H-X9-DG protein
MNRSKAVAAGFTLIELLCVLGIVALLSAMLAPAVGKIQERAYSTACANNLRQIGASVQLYMADHENTFPYIETDPQTQKLYPPEEEVKGMLETLEPYGIKRETLRCTSDVKSHNEFETKGTSYEWRPFLDGEKAANPQIFRRRGAMNISPSRFRQVQDFWPVHNGRQNLLYADGHVRSF